MERAYALSFGIAFAASLFATFAMRSIARRFGWVARPRSDRWHRKPTALLGGVGIFAGFLVAYLIDRPAALSGDALLVACSAAMFAIGLVDDRVQLKPYTKLVGQIAVATLVTSFGLRLHWLPNGVLDQGLTIFWLVGITNALNLLDNIDGAAAGIAAIAALFLVYFGHAQGHAESARLAAAFAGATVGFLVFNFHPASIFMGDCGSLFLGFFLGGFSLVGSDVTGARRNVLAVLTIPVLLLMMPILDTTLVTISRRYYGRSVSQGGRDHTSHRLVALGLSERGATLMLWAIAATSGWLAVLVQNTSQAVAGGVIAVFGMGMLFLMVFLGRVKVYDVIEHESERGNRALLPTLADFSYKRRVFETLNDLVLVLLSYYCAYLLRFEGMPAEQAYLARFVQSLPVVVVVQMSVFLVAGLYRGVWRYTGLDDLTTIVRAVGAAAATAAIALQLLFRYEGLSRSVMVIDALLLLVGVAGSRVSFRLLRNWITRNRPDGQRVLIYGAGDGGELLLREMRNNSDLGLVPVGFVDDDPQKAGRMIHGVPVIGTFSELDRVIASSKVQLVLASTGKIDPGRWAEVERTCVARGLGARRMRIALE
jgi:UDP-GlcNAc:undecaprenyl-phosphate GlcNAc-1-phosphate transferase